MAGLVHPAVVGFIVTLLAGAGIVVTKRWHSATTADSETGPQKFHDSAATPRIGGLAVLAGYGVAVSVSAPPARDLLLGVGISAGLALLGGLAEDLTKKVHPATRLITTTLAGLTFCLLTGYVVRHVEIVGVDDFLAIPVIALGFTVFAMAGMAHAINMIDGFHGLAAGTAVILLIAFSFVCLKAGDDTLAGFCLTVIGVLAGFAVLNFPFGYIFLGDGGAYFVGIVLAGVAVMVPMRNPGISPWISIVVLAYPLMETAASFIRKIRAGANPFKPDRRHLHMLVYECWGTRIAKAAGVERLANPVTGMLMWSQSVASLMAVALIAPSREWSLLACALLAALYMTAYRKFAGIPLHDRLSRQPRSKRCRPD